MTLTSLGVRGFALLLLAGACGGSNEKGLFGTDTLAGERGGSAGERGGTGGSTGDQAGGASPQVSGGVAGTNASASGSGGKRVEPVGGKAGGMNEGGSPGKGGASGKGGAAQSEGGALASGGTLGASGGQGGAGGQEAASGQGGSADCLSASEACDGLDNDCDNQVDEGDSLCPDGCQGFALEGKAYLFCTEPTEAALDFEAAGAFCADRGMHLVWIESKQENDDLLAAFTELGLTGRAWIGASDAAQEAQWRWINSDGTQGPVFWSGGSPEVGGAPVGARYSSWGPERPNDETTGGDEDCASFTVLRDNLPPGTWNDDKCTGIWPFVCEAL